MRLLIISFALAAVFLSSAHAAGGSERKAILEVVRTNAEVAAGQPVRIKIDRLNIDNGWAILTGELVPPSGKSLDWSKASGCIPSLDKGLWVVLHKQANSWQIEQIDICAPEPRYWSIEEEVGLIWPCGVYAGLEASSLYTLEQRCRELKAKSKK